MNVVAPARKLSALLLIATLHAAALAAPTGTRFETSAQVASTRLQLNGAGTRFKAIFKVYDMALYTTRKVGTPEELLALPASSAPRSAASARASRLPAISPSRSTRSTSPTCTPTMSAG